MSNEQLSPEDFSRVVNRDGFVKRELSARVASLIQENLELVSVIHDLQQDLDDLRRGQQVLDPGQQQQFAFENE